MCKRGCNTAPAAEISYLGDTQSHSQSHGAPSLCLALRRLPRASSAVGRDNSSRRGRRAQGPAEARPRPTSASHEARARPLEPSVALRGVPCGAGVHSAWRGAPCPPPRGGVPPLAVSTTRAGLPYAPQRVEAARTDQRLWLRKLRMCLELRRQPWHGGAGLLGPTGDRREPHQSWSLSATERGAVASPTGARTARRRHRPRREGVLLASSEWGINGGRTAEVLQRLRVLLPTPRRAGRARAGQNGAPRGAQAVPGGEALSTKMGDAHAEHAPEGLANTAVAWGTLVSSW